MRRTWSLNGSDEMRKSENMTGDVPISAELNNNMIRCALKFFDAPPIDLHDAQQVHDRILEYFDECQKRELRPSNLGLYSALGMSRQDVDNVIHGRSRSKVSREAIDLIKRAKTTLSAYRESLAMCGKLNPVTAIFWGKNFDSMSDSQTLEITRSDIYASDMARMTPEEISARIAQDIPLEPLEDTTAEVLQIEG